MLDFPNRLAVRPLGHALAVLALLLAAAAHLRAQLPGQVLAHDKLSVTSGGFAGTVDDGDAFGWSVCALGDVDGDGVVDLAIGAPSDDDGSADPFDGDRGAVWIVFMNADGTARTHRKISDTQGLFTGVLDDGDGFGSALASPGDLDGNGVPDLSVGAPFDDDGGTRRGAVWILYLASDGTVAAHTKISDTSGGFAGILDDHDQLGYSLAALGDFDGDGIGDLAAGAPADGDGGFQHGAAWLLLLRADGTVKSHRKLSDTAGGFGGVLDDGDGFGWSVAGLGDFDGDGVRDLAVGAPGDDDGGAARGAAWVLLLQADGTVKSHRKLSDTAGNFIGVLDDGDSLGASLAAPGDVDLDGVPDLVAGAPADGDGGPARGALWVLFLEADGTVRQHQKISDLLGAFGGALDDFDFFAIAAAPLGDFDGDGFADLAAGAFGDDDGGADRGALWLLYLQGGPESPWSDLGFALAGTHGEPLLAGDGTLVAGEPLTISLTNALESTTAFFVLGLSTLEAPFKGGTFVPNFEPGVLTAFPTSPAGTAIIPTVTPAGLPAGLELYIQYWLIDAGGPVGFAASNAVVGVTP